MFYHQKSKIIHLVLSKKLVSALSVCSLLSPSLFSAGYVLPSGTVVYDNTTDKTVYKVEKISPLPPVTGVSETAPMQTTTVVIEDRVVTYDNPVIIRERIVERGPVYDVVDTAGKILFFGLLYDALSHGFFHHSPSGGHARFDHYRR